MTSRVIKVMDRIYEYLLEFSAIFFTKTKIRLYMTKIRLCMTKIGLYVIIYDYI